MTAVTRCRPISLLSVLIYWSQVPPLVVAADDPLNAATRREFAERRLTLSGVPSYLPAWVPDVRWHSSKCPSETGPEKPPSVESLQ